MTPATSPFTNSNLFEQGKLQHFVTAHNNPALRQSALSYHNQMRIAFFGGSFDPPHLAHVAIARAAQQALHLDQVLFAPVGLQPLKPSGSSASFADRVAMTQLALAKEPGFQISLADAPNPSSNKPNYTIDTLTQLHSQLPPQTELFLLLGADSFRTLHHWHRAAEIPFAATIIVAARPNQDLDNLPALLPPTVTLLKPTNSVSESTAATHYRLANTTNQQADLYILPHLHLQISATTVRGTITERIAPTATQLLAPAVSEYIHQHHLYQHGQPSS